VGALQELDRLLIAAESDLSGYVEVDQYDAHARMQELTDDDWIQLRDLWKQRSSDWQLVLASLLEDGPPGQTIAILLEMLESMNIDLMEAALDALPPELPDISLSEPVIARLLRKSERFNRNVFLENRNLPRLLKAAGHPSRE
jgi:hypothetical protein